MPDPSPPSEPVTVRKRPFLNGIDCSAYQGRIDWQRVRAAGYSFAWLKASEGGTHTDARFVENWSGAWAAGLLRGAYHYLAPSSSSAEQAVRFLSVYPGGGELPVAIDVEIAGRGETPASVVDRALEWCRLVEAETGAAVIVYTFPSFAARYLRGPNAVELATRKLWIAHYTPHGEPPTVPEPWRTWAAWQTTGDGRVDGIAGKVDLDVLRPEAFGLAQEAGAG